MHNEAFCVKENELSPWVRRRNGIKYLIYPPCQYFVIFTLSLVAVHMSRASPANRLSQFFRLLWGLKYSGELKLKVIAALSTMKACHQAK